MTPPPRDADRRTALARLAKAREFAEAAELHFDQVSGAPDYPDVYVTLAVHAGIAAADVICIRRLGEYSASGAHDEAIKRLALADKALAKHLSRLLALKTKAGYSANPVSADDVSIARRAHMALLESATELL